MKVSAVVPTKDRPGLLTDTVRALLAHNALDHAFDHAFSTDLIATYKPA